MEQTVDSTWGVYPTLKELLDLEGELGALKFSHMLYARSAETDSAKRRFRGQGTVYGISVNRCGGTVADDSLAIPVGANR